jgi:hypothetical protein
VFFAGLLVVGAFVAILYAESIVEVTAFTRSDDGPAYDVFAKEILELGASDQDFSMRRMGTYGGQSWLHAMLLAHSWIAHLNMIDAGLCLAIAFALLLGEARRLERAFWPLLLLPLLVLVTLPNVRVNAQSAMSGTVFFLALHRTMLHAGERPRAGAALAIALLAAAVCTLRQNYLVPAAVYVATSYGAMVVRGARGHSVRAALSSPEAREAGLAALATVLFLLPWAVGAYRAFGTPTFPFPRGNFRAPELFGVKGNWLVHARIVWSNATHDGALKTLPLFLVAGLLVADKTPRRSLWATYAAGLVGFLALVGASESAHENSNARFYFAFEIAAVLAISTEAFHAWQHDRARQAWGGALAAIAALVQMHDVRGEWRQRVLESLDKLHDATLRRPSPVEDDVLAHYYGDLQDSIPRGSAFAAMVDDPWRFDFARNSIHVLDLPGLVSPGPGMPLEDPGALARYFLARDIRYLVYVKPAASYDLYRHNVWEDHAHSSDVELAVMAKYFLKVFDRVAELSRTQATVYDKNNLVVLDLREPADVARASQPP